MDERLSELDALLHARGVPSQLPVSLFEQANVPQGFGGALTGGGAREAANLGHVSHKFRR